MISFISLMIRFGDHVIAVVSSKKGFGEVNLLNHNGLDVRTRDDVDEAHRVVSEPAEEWKLTKISKPVLQHGTYSVYFWDADLLLKAGVLVRAVAGGEVGVDRLRLVGR
jgi:hypothetical protein